MGITQLVFLAGLLFFSCSRHYGIYHEVNPGENLFRIAVAYETNYQELAEINNLEDPSSLGVGQKVFIPGVKKERWVRTANGKYSFPSKKTKYTPVKTYRGKYIWPVQGVISSRFGPRRGNMHDGLDIAAKKGTPIRAAASGRVIYSGKKLKGYGKMIIIKHEGVISSVYAHNDKNYAKRKDFVKRGEIIARVGKTGRASGPHLHFEIRKGRKAMNPLFYLPKK